MAAPITAAPPAARQRVRPPRQQQRPPAPAVVLPIRSITPGALNPNVRQGTIRRTICKAGWTAKVRPPVSYTNTLKAKQMPIYELGGSPSLYEEDHLIPLELGGAPRNPKNLWPESRTQAKKSDPLETKLKRQVCKRQITLARARTAIRCSSSSSASARPKLGDAVPVRRTL
jgi:hypothetical protein